MSGDSGDTNGGSNGKRSFLEAILAYSQTVLYYGVTLLLVATSGMLFVYVGMTFLTVFGGDPLQTALDVLDGLLLITIFIELLITVEVLVREGKLVAEPFILIALLAVVRRILLITAETKQNISSPETYLNLVTELGVLTVLVLALAAGLWVARSTRQATS